MTRLVDIDALSAEDLSHLEAAKRMREAREGWEPARRPRPEPVDRSVFNLVRSRLFDLDWADLGNDLEQLISEYNILADRRVLAGTIEDSAEAVAA